MRLNLHGRSKPSMLYNQLQRARSSQTITTLILSCWDPDEMDDEVVQALVEYLQSLPSHQLEDITLQNCSGGQQDKLVAAIVHTSPKCFTIRYDKQQTELPTSVVTGLVQGSAHGSRLQAIQLRGVTLTASVVDSFRLALPQLPELTSLSIQSNFTLHELDRKQVSILGRDPEDVDDVFYEMIRLLQDLPRLTTLGLEHCHIPDRYLAELLRAAKKSSLQTLHLRGNMAQQETMEILSDWMLAKYCRLQHIDVSWQRLVGSKSNCSPFSTQMPFLAKAIHHNTSLKSLRISENRLSDVDVKLLVTSLAQNKTLQDLEIKDCRISMDGFHLIAKYMPAFHLVRLDVNGCQQVEGSKLKSLFFKPLSQNVYLLDFILPQIESKSLGWILEWNKAGRRVLTASPPLAPSLWPQVLQRADHVGRGASDRQPDRHAATSIFYLFREKGFEVVAKNHEKKMERAKKQQQRMWFAANEWDKKPSTLHQSPQRISPVSSFDDYHSEYSVSPTKYIRHMTQGSGEVELHLEEASLFDKDEPLASCSRSSPIKPNPNLARPNLMSSRKPSATSGGFDPVKWMRQGNNHGEPIVTPRTTLSRINAQ